MGNFSNIYLSKETVTVMLFFSKGGKTIQNLLHERKKENKPKLQLLQHSESHFAKFTLSSFLKIDLINSNI